MPSDTLYSDFKFAYGTAAPIQDWPYYEVQIVGRDIPQLDENVAEMLEFLGRALDSDEAASGFKLTYDLRNLRVPTLSLLISIAKWASTHERQSAFKERVVASRVCVMKGSKLTFAKLAMTTFFKVSPPTCTTYLVSDLDGEPFAVYEGKEPPTSSNSMRAKQDPGRPLNVASSGPPEDSQQVNNYSTIGQHKPGDAAAGVPGEVHKKLTLNASRSHGARGVSCFTCFGGLFVARRHKDPELSEQVRELQQQVDEMRERLLQCEKLVMGINQK